jgi:cytochrome c nitrite reductase small subunit
MIPSTPGADGDAAGVTRARWIETGLAVAVGLAAGVGLYTFIYARGSAYLTSDPAACANCHVMRAHFDAWLKSSHRAVATCNDCHTPPGVVAKWLVKGENGFRHSLAFTTGWFPDAISITPDDLAVAERACRKCHSEVALEIERPHGGQGAEQCVRCHVTVGHLE